MRSEGVVGGEIFAPHPPPSPEAGSNLRHQGERELGAHKGRPYAQSCLHTPINP